MDIAKVNFAAGIILLLFSDSGIIRTCVRHFAAKMLGFRRFVLKWQFAVFQASQKGLFPSLNFREVIICYKYAFRRLRSP